MNRLVGVVAALLCLLSAAPAAPQGNIAPPGWKPVGPSAEPKGLSGNANINDALNGSARSVSVGIGAGAAAGTIVAYRQSNPTTNKLEILVKRPNGNLSAWEQVGDALNTTPGDVFDPKVQVSAAGDIFVAWRQLVSFNIALYLLKWSGVAWVPLPGADADGRVTTDADVPSTIKDFDFVLDPDGHPILAFQTPAGASCSFDVDPNPACSDQIYVMSCDDTACGFLGGGPNAGGGASNAKSFRFPLDAPTSTAFHGAVGPGVASTPSGAPVVTFFYTNAFDTPPTGFQGNRDDVYVKAWDGTNWVPVGPAVPEPGSAESLGAPGGVSATNAFGTKAGLGGASSTKTPPSIAIDPATGDILLGWGEGVGNSDDFGNPFTWIRVSIFDGNNWFELGPPAVADFNGTASNIFPSVGFYGDLGTPMALWQHNTPNFATSSIYARQFLNDSTWGEMGQGSATALGGGVGGTQSNGFAPALAIDPAPNHLPFAVWIEQGITFPPQVFGRSYDPSAAAPSPTITGFTPTSGPVGTDVTISGNNLDLVTIIKFGSLTETSPKSVLSSGLVVTVPPGAKTGKITVESPGGVAASTGTYTVTPRVDAFSPTAAGFGQTVTITGFNLRVGSADPVVKFGGVTAGLTGGALNDSIVKAIVPATAVTGPISVTTSDGTGTSVTDFTVIEPPQITSIAPVFGPRGTLVQILGSGLVSVEFVSFNPWDTTTGRFQNASTFTILSPNRIDLFVPLGAGTGAITVVNPVGSAKTPAFKVLPDIEDVFPTDATAGSDGTIVTVSGTTLYSSPTSGPPVVKVGNVTIPVGNLVGPLPAGPSAATPAAVTVTSPVRFRVPLGTPSGKVTITTAAGSSTSTATLNVVQPPKIVTFTPTSGPVGTPVTITGTGLNGSTLVTFGGNASAMPTQVTATSIKVTVPDGALSGPLMVSTDAGTATSATSFKVTPKITDFAPGSVVAGSATSVTVNGSNLRAGPPPVVKVGAIVVSVNASSLTQLQFTVPLLAVTGKISVTTADGTAMSDTALTVIQPPKITSFAPLSGPAGMPVTLTGANFSGNLSVTFGGNVTVAATLVSATMVKATVPDGALTGKLTVTNEAGSGTSVGVFKVSPKLTGFSPASVVAGGSTPVTITGSNLQAATGVSTVKVGAFVILPTSVLANSSASIQFIVPLGAVTGKLSVTTVDGIGTNDSNLVVIQPPKAVSFAPTSGPVGTMVTLTGANFSGNLSVTFGGNITVAATLLSATMVKATVPVGAITGKLTVTNEAGSGTTTTPFKVSPKLTGFSPASVVAGSSTPVTITGSNLVALTGAPIVKVGAFAIPSGSVLANTSTAIQFTLPLGAVTGKLSVTTVDGMGTNNSNLLVIQPPKVASFAPAAAPVGTTIMINGANLTGVSTVTFTGPVTVTPTAVLATSVKAVVPPGALTGPITVENPAGVATSTAIFKVMPKITGFRPASVPAGSSTPVTVTGFNLRAATGLTTIKVGAFTIPFAAVQANTSTTIQFTVPLGAVTGKISVTTIDGMGMSGTDLLVIQPPKPVSFVPVMGTVGTPITINGTNLLGVTDVTFTGPVTVTPTAVTATSLKVTVPAGALTGPVSVTNSAGTGASTASFKLLPSISGFAPGSAAAGAIVTISGNNLKVGATNPVVKVGTFTAAVNASTTTEVAIVVPGPAKTGKIMLTTTDGSATSATELIVTTAQVPDLQVTSVLGPAVAVRSLAGKPQSFMVTTTVTNQGPAAAGQFNVALILVSPDPTSGPAAVRTIGNRSVTSLASAASSTASTLVTLPTDIGPGSYELHAVADAVGLVTELDETNNEAIAAAPVTVVDAVAGTYDFTFDVNNSPCLNTGILNALIHFTGTGAVAQALDRFTASSFSVVSGQLRLNVTAFTAKLDAAGNVSNGTFKFSTTIQGISVTGAGQFSGTETGNAFSITSLTAQTTSPPGCIFSGAGSFAPH